jgi:hypothetical protein
MRARGKRESDNQTRDSGLRVKQRDRVDTRTPVRGIPTPPRIQYLRTGVDVEWTEKRKRICNV